MPILSVIAFSCVAAAITSLQQAAKGHHRYYWLAAVAIYVFSFLAGFSIGQATVGLTFIPLALAVGHAVGLIKNRNAALVAGCAGAAAGLIAVLYIDDYWMFLPIAILLQLVLQLD